jgi:hypothetical protein
LNKFIKLTSVGIGCIEDKATSEVPPSIPSDCTSGLEMPCNLVAPNETYHTAPKERWQGSESNTHRVPCKVAEEEVGNQPANTVYLSSERKETLAAG